MSVSLRAMNTLGVDCEVDTLTIAESTDELHQLLMTARLRGRPFTVLGGGSNTVLRRRLPGDLILVRNRGIRVRSEDTASVLLEVGAGCVWDDVVRHTLARGWFGLENLVLIPGTAGAAPIQNIGAYGVELSDRLETVTAFDLDTGLIEVLSASACGFGYRTSVFKTTGRWIITSLHLRLRKQPALNLGYPELAQRVQARSAPGGTSAAELADVVAHIRREKLPDPARIGNVGSFFKNPVVTVTDAERLRSGFHALQTYPVQGCPDLVKLSAAQLIDRAGWKGRVLYGVGVWERQPLVLVNRGTRSGSDFLQLAEAIRTDLLDRYGVALEREPVVLGQD